MADSPIAEFDQISKAYRRGVFRRRVVHALCSVSLKIPGGQVFALVGPNRAGKTTLIKILLSLCAPDSGRATRFGRATSDRATLARVGYVHENQSFPRYWNAAGLLEYYGALTLMQEPAVRARVPQLLQQVGLSDRSGEPVRNFSKGMIQRLGLAQALLNDPELLIMDEPTEGLDLEGRQIVSDIVADRRRRGRSVLLVSHALGEVEQLCDSVAVMVGGRLVYAGNLADLKRDRGTQVIRPLAEALRELYGGATK